MNILKQYISIFHMQGLTLTQEGRGLFFPRPLPDLISLFQDEAVPPSTFLEFIWQHFPTIHHFYV